MKYKILILSAIFTFFVFSANSQTTTWADNSANVIEKGRKELGIFSPLAIGINDKTELTLHPIYFFVIPNLSVKHQWKHSDKLTISTMHKFTYPTFLMKLVARGGTGGLLPSTSKIPHLFKFNNAVLLSSEIKNQTLTFKAGVDLAFGAGESSFPVIEYHVLYPRTYSLHNMYMPYVGFDVTGNIYKKFAYDYNVNAFFLLKENKGMILEQEVKLMWQKSDNFAVKIGAIIEYGDYPFGKGFGALPVFDLMFAF